jgi:hypothetical protein
MRLVRLLFLSGYALITLSFAVCGFAPHAEEVEPEAMERTKREDAQIG